MQQLIGYAKQAGVVAWLHCYTVTMVAWVNRLWSLGIHWLLGISHR